MQPNDRMTAQILALLLPCDLEWTSRSFKLESNCSTIPSLKQIGSGMSLHRVMLNVHFIKSRLQGSLPWILLCKYILYEFQQADFIQIDNNISEKIDTDDFDFWYNCGSEWR